MEKVLHISKKVGNVIIWISILALVVMIVITIADIFMREVFRNPITGSVEIVRMMMICMSPAFISALFLNRMSVSACLSIASAAKVSWPLMSLDTVCPRFFVR